MLERGPDKFPQETRAQPATRQVQKRDWCPMASTTSVGLADNAAGGQIHSPTVSNTI